MMIIELFLLIDASSWTLFFNLILWRYDSLILEISVLELLVPNGDFMYKFVILLDLFRNYDYFLPLCLNSCQSLCTLL